VREGVALGDGDQEAGVTSLLEEIVAQLGSDPAQCWQAVEGLTALEQPARLAIIAELASFSRRAGVETLLRLLATGRDEATRSAARNALEHPGDDRTGRDENGRLGAAVMAPRERQGGNPVEYGSVPTGQRMVAAISGDEPRIVHCLVTPVDGRGRGSIVVSVSESGQRRTAAFLCDVQHGVCDVFGEVEPESPTAGGLLEELQSGGADDGARDAPELALGLLAGSLMLGAGEKASAVRDWISGTVGPELHPTNFSASIVDLVADQADLPALPEQVCDLFDACPSWLDDSLLVRELAHEIVLREGRTESDPERDAGAYRFLFEHRLIHRLELYRRMLLWMAGIWQCSGQLEMARSAQALLCQLCDDQYAVPSMPFFVELTRRSLAAAQAVLGGGRAKASPGSHPASP
jgi:hypothetical protein